MAEFEPVRSFDVDDGQLDGLSPQQCFVLGYELSLVDEAITRPAAIDRPVHALNRDRIIKEFERQGRAFEITWMSEDGSESWCWLKSPAIRSVDE